MRTTRVVIQAHDRYQWYSTVGLVSFRTRPIRCTVESMKTTITNANCHCRAREHLSFHLLEICVRRTIGILSNNGHTGEWCMHRRRDRGGFLNSRKGLLDPGEDSKGTDSDAPQNNDPERIRANAKSESILLSCCSDILLCSGVGDHKFLRRIQGASWTSYVPRSSSFVSPIYRLCRTSSVSVLYPSAAEEAVPLMLPNLQEYILQSRRKSPGQMVSSLRIEQGNVSFVHWIM